MDIDEFMDISTPIKRIALSSGSKKTYEECEKNNLFKIEKKQSQGNEYALELKEEQQEKILKKFTTKHNDSSESNSQSIHEPLDDSIHHYPIGKVR